jgi:hypothetical protein
MSFEGDTKVVVGKFGTPGRAHLRNGCGARRRAGDVSKAAGGSWSQQDNSIYGFGCRRRLFRPLPLHPGVASGHIDNTEDPPYCKWRILHLEPKRI